jgi:signal transduction histidine kinase
MKGGPSFRAHVLIGALLWTIGLCGLAVFFSTYAMLHYPNFPQYLHSPAIHHRHWYVMAILVALIAGLLHVRKGLSPFAQLRRRLAAVRGGEVRRLDGRYPSEVQPVVDDLNALLEDRDQRVERAIAKAGDLAHGLKTPLAVLAQEAERAEAAGHDELAASINEQVERMRRQVDYHLAQARAAASGADPSARTAVIESVTALVRTMERLHAGRGLRIDVDAERDHHVRARREDLDEMLGNLLDNACKWARSRVVIRATADAKGTAIVIEDDGPGIEPSLRDAVLRRGVRADEAAPGSGLGLAIVRDLAELHGGSVMLESAELGGLRARLTLPS